MQEWLERTNWSRRSAGFGELFLRGDEVHFELRAGQQQQTWDAWMALPRHRHILTAVATEVVRYAAIDWSRTPLPITSSESLTLASGWGATLAQTYKDIARAIDADRLAWLARPFVQFDIAGRIRIGFTRADGGNKLAPEALDQWPLCDERALVYVVARTLLDLTREMPWESRLGTILTRALHRDPALRHPNLNALRLAFESAAGPRLKVEDERIWSFLELGIGYLEAGLAARAFDCFNAATGLYPHAAPGQQLARIAAARMRSDEAAPARPKHLPAYALDLLGVTAWPPQGPLPWRTVERVGHALERDRNFDGALAIYQHVRFDGEPETAVNEHALARARCCVELGNADTAVGLARKILERDPRHRDARALEVNTLLAVKLHADALAACDAWSASFADDPEAHYSRGKALLGLRKLVEARDAFDRACTLGPHLVQAMWLRTAVDRSLARLRAVAGTPVPMTDGLSPGALRDALLAGRIAEGIAILEREPTSLRLADLLWYAGRFEDALRIYEALDGDDALAGRARCLLDLGRTDEALAILDRIGSDGFTSLRRDRA